MGGNFKLDSCVPTYRVYKSYVLKGLACHTSKPERMQLGISPFISIMAILNNDSHFMGECIHHAIQKLVPFLLRACIQSARSLDFKSTSHYHTSRPTH